MIISRGDFVVPGKSTTSLGAVVLALGLFGAACSSGTGGSAASSGASTPQLSPSVPTTLAPATLSASTGQSTAPSSGATSGSVDGVPTMGRIKDVMARTVEKKNPRTHFVRSGVVATVSDGHGGKLSAVVGRRSGAADSGGEVVFFFHGTKFLGWDGDTETGGVKSLSGAGTGAFKVRYVHYAAADPACCASLKPVTVHWVWQDEDGFVPSGGTRPHGLGDPVRVRLMN
jgi:hypothetical protein